MSLDKNHEDGCTAETGQETGADEKVDAFVETLSDKVVGRFPISEKTKIVIVINNQFTSAPNTTQIASGAGRNSAAGSNAAIDSSNTEQQQSVGAEGEAKNFGMNGNQCEPHEKHEDWGDGDELVIVINNQINQAGEVSSATQVASGSGTDSAGGTNAAIASSNTKQQHSVGGDGVAVNDGENGSQEEV
ncbi:hypothetical protein F9802_09035 [Bacillus aerolatus]|uniref:Uncharacterized protein n=1 Tax=Bacillus aerolatus TaxID=2653354 RepID=A0A6I1FKF9_9BACI|nr:hypothetical protein [Bacillus aerolatus]KAB7707142.1 hypothetical protein F9802_09035 [Bacillus aerolatus]